MENKNVFQETVDTLIDDAKKLSHAYNYWLEQGEYKKSIDTLRLLKDTLSLIKEYDWHLEYSENEEGIHKKISVWEQNHDGEIRNQKTWNVGNNVIYIDFGTDITYMYVGRRRYSFDLRKHSEEFINTVKDFANENTSIYVDDMGIGKLICDLLDKNDISYNTIRRMPVFVAEEKC